MAVTFNSSWSRSSSSHALHSISPFIHIHFLFPHPVFIQIILSSSVDKFSSLTLRSYPPLFNYTSSFPSCILSLLSFLLIYIHLIHFLISYLFLLLYPSIFPLTIILSRFLALIFTFSCLLPFLFISFLFPSFILA